MKSSRRKKPRGQLQRHQRHGVFHGHRPYSRRGLYAFICLAKCGRNNTGKVPAAGIKLPKQTVQIFNVAFLPGAIRVGKVDLAMQPFFHTAPVGEPVSYTHLDVYKRQILYIAWVLLFPCLLFPFSLITVLCGYRLCKLCRDLLSAMSQGVLVSLLYMLCGP